MKVSPRITDVSLLTARLVVGGIFLIASVDKVRSPGAFADAVRTFHILPPDLVMPFAFAVPWLELLVAVYLLVGFLSRLAASGAAIMLAGFVYALGDALATGKTDHPCGCFGSGADPNPILAFLSGGSSVTWWDVIRDLILIALSLVIAVWGAGSFSVDGLIARSKEPSGKPREERRGAFQARDA